MRLAMVLAALLLAGCNQASTDVRTAGLAADAAPAARFTKEQFDRHIQNRTKDQIMAEFGSPEQIHDGSDTWYYSTLPVYDAAGGRQTPVWIRFAGVEGDQDFAVAATY